MLHVAPVKPVAKLVFNSRGTNPGLQVGELLQLAPMGVVHRWLQGGEKPLLLIGTISKGVIAGCPHPLLPGLGLYQARRLAVGFLALTPIFHFFGGCSLFVLWLTHYGANIRLCFM